MVTAGVEKEMETISTKENGSAAPNLDIRKIKLSAVDGLYLKVSLEAGGPIPLGNDPAITESSTASVWIRMSRAGDACPALMQVSSGPFTDSVLAAALHGAWSSLRSVWHGSVATSQGRRKFHSRCRERC